MEQSKRVLVVEDDEAIRLMMTDMLNVLGCAVTAVMNGEEAAEALARDPSFDLLITDFHMPRLDGYALLRFAREHHFHCPVVFTSSDNTLTSRDQMALGDCCASMLPKPFGFAELRAKVASALTREHHRDCLHWPDRPEEETRWQESSSPPPP